MYAPLAIELQDRACLVVGGGDVAFRKSETLLKYGARVSVAAPVLRASFREIQGRIRVINRPVRPEDISSRYLLVCAATDDPQTNRMVGDLCTRANILVNVADRSAPSSFLFPAVVDRGPLQVAVSTSGNSPRFSRFIRDEIAGAYGEEYRVFLEYMGELRQMVIDRFPPGQRIKIFDMLIRSEALPLIRESLAQDGLKKKGPVQGSSGRQGPNQKVSGPQSPDQVVPGRQSPASAGELLARARQVMHRVIDEQSRKGQQDESA